MTDEVRALRGEGRWDEALALVDDPLARADLLNEQALFTGSQEARAAATRELDRAEALLELARGRVLHARFLAERVEDPAELAHFERGLALARRSDDPLLEGWARFWLGIVRQVVRGESDASRGDFEAAYTVAAESGDRVLASYAIRHLGFCHDEAGDGDAAWSAFEESVRLRREEHFLPGVAAGLLTLGEVALERDRPEEARDLLAEAHRLAEQAGCTAFLQRIEAVEARLP